MKLPAQRFACLQIHDSDAVRFITLDRPYVKNAFNDELYDGVRQTLEESAADASVSVCLITGSGDTFSAGQDLKALADIRDRPAPANGQVFSAFARALAAFDKPLIAAVNGAAVGVGATLLLHCDLVLVSETARFKLPFVGLGLVPEVGSSALLPATIGPQAAAHLLYTGDWMDAEEAVRQGLAWKRFAPDQLAAEAAAVARRIAAAPLESLVKTKRLLQAARGPWVTAAVERELIELEGIVRLMRAGAVPRS